METGPRGSTVPRWQHHFTVPITIPDSSTVARGADGVYFQYGNALSTVSFFERCTRQGVVWLPFS